MKRVLKQLILSAALVFGFVAAIAPAPVSAVDICPPGADANSPVCQDSDAEAGNLVTTIVNILLFVVGIVAVIMIIIGGLMYVVSGGDAGSVTKAKNTILYSVIGLLIAILAYAIVNWVVGIAS